MKQSTSSPCHDLSAKIAFLSHPQSYPEDAGHVEVLETHLSWLFLTSRHVYKMKKPVRYPFVDLSTLALRRRNCAEEMRLNRMLASEVYLDLVQLSWQAERGYSLEGEGMPAEVLVKMLRLPQQPVSNGSCNTAAPTPTRCGPQASSWLASTAGQPLQVP
jgi:uncharacterized protein